MRLPFSLLYLTTRFIVLFSFLHLIVSANDVTTITEYKTVTQPEIKENFITKTVYVTELVKATNSPVLAIPYREKVGDVPSSTINESDNEFENFGKTEDLDKALRESDSSQLSNIDPKWNRIINPGLYPNIEFDDVDNDGKFEIDVDDVSGEEFGFDPEYFARRIKPKKKGSTRKINPNVVDLNEKGEIIYEKLHKPDFLEGNEDIVDLDVEENHHDDSILNLVDNPNEKSKTKENEPIFPYEPDFVFDYNPSEEFVPFEHTEFEKVEEFNPDDIDFYHPTEDQKDQNLSSSPNKKGKGKQIIGPHDPESSFIDSQNETKSLSNNFFQNSFQYGKKRPGMSNKYKNGSNSINHWSVLPTVIFMTLYPSIMLLFL